MKKIQKIKGCSLMGSQKKLYWVVTPAKAGVQSSLKYWIPASAGMTHPMEF
jgi:hypothetical protein